MPAPKRILVVEDSELVVDALRILFEDAGYVVSVAGSVNEAVQAATSEVVDMILLDLTLPDGNGLDVLHALKAKVALPKATLAMTGHNDDATRRACLAAGCADVLLKPVPIGDLLRLIELHLA
jgi:CheY-like chemotaxis protein